jgi:hypothetical protein
VINLSPGGAANAVRAIPGRRVRGSGDAPPGNRRMAARTRQIRIIFLFGVGSPASRSPSKISTFSPRRAGTVYADRRANGCAFSGYENN